MTALGAQARQLRAALAGAPDGSLARVVAMLDAMAERGEADALLEGVRPRLRRLRPPRPLGFSRLLLMPLEGALLPAGAWRGTGADLPRSAIAPLVPAVRLALGGMAAEIQAAAAGHASDDTGLVARLGARLWPAAGAAVLPCPPPGWEEAGLPGAAAAPALALCQALWRHAPALWAARETAEDGPPEPLLRAALEPLAAEGPGPLAAGMALLLRHAAAPGQVATRAIGLCATTREVAERELAALLARDAAAIASGFGTAGAVEDAVALAGRLAGLEAVTATGALPGCRAPLAAARRQAIEACRIRLSEGLSAGLLRPVERALAGPGADDATVAALEAAARDLHRLGAAGARLGGDAALRRIMDGAVAQLLALGATGGGLSRVEVARLVEILAGPEAALPLLAVPG